MVLEPPALDIDLRIARIRGGADATVKLPLDARLERRAVWAIIKHLEAQGWTPERELTEDEPTPDAKAVMELVFNLDESRVRFTKGEARGWVFFVRGNSPEEILSDYTTNLPLNDFDVEAAL